MSVVSAVGYTRIAEETDRPQSTKPVNGEKTGRQDTTTVVYNLSAPNGGDPNNPCGFFNYGRYYGGTYRNYRFMLEHPRIRHARAQVVGSFSSVPWSWQTTPGKDPTGNRTKFVADVLTDVRANAMEDLPRALDYGHFNFEKVWTPRAGRWVIDRLKPLSVDATGIMVDHGGNLAGIRWGTSGQTLDKLDSFVWTYDGEAGELYGRSRLENMRSTAWRDWLDTATQLQWTCQKIAGKLVVITTPSGTFQDENDRPVSWRDNAMAAGKAMADPRSNGVIWLPTPALPDFRNKEDVDFAKLSLVNIDVKEFGDHAAAVRWMLSRLQWNEELFFAGYLRSPRTGMESKTGSRADSEQHTDTDSNDIDLLSMRCAAAFTNQVVDDLLEINFGKDARGSVRAIAGKLRDEHRETDLTILDAAFTNPDTSTPLLRKFDFDAIADRRGIPKTEEINLDKDIDENTDGAGDEVPPTDPLNPNDPKNTDDPAADE